MKKKRRENIQHDGKKATTRTLRLVKSFLTRLFTSFYQLSSLLSLYSSFTSTLLCLSLSLSILLPRVIRPSCCRCAYIRDYRELNGITRENETKEAYYGELFFNFQLFLLLANAKFNLLRILKFMRQVKRITKVGEARLKGGLNNYII